MAVLLQKNMKVQKIQVIINDFTKIKFLGSGAKLGKTDKLENCKIKS